MCLCLQDFHCHGSQWSAVHDMRFSPHTYREARTGSQFACRSLMPLYFTTRSTQVERLNERQRVLDSIDSMQHELKDIIKLMGSPGTNILKKV